ncbi:MAG: nickel-dependent hydrogenase large subunit [Nanoarchaeota archaeon]|nr:nickel-dependent hydrogenase large subunit [Nanoarchaeota archaeon]MCG2717470.1 nickel-dependent hydrogenase large subunit [Nanoarchaeota archaeon]
MHDHTHTIPVGPQSPTMKEPMCIRVNLEGNYIKKAHVRMGYLHKGIENMLEGKSLIKCLYITEHICGICSYAHSACFTQAVERLYKIDAHKKAKYIRTIVAELERIHSHLLWFGFAMHEIGYDTMFQYGMREREYVLECFEKITGNRVIHAINKFGTVRYDFDKEKEGKFILDKLAKIEKIYPFYEKMARKNSVITSRMKEVGTISKSMAIKHCMVGPMARASGIKRDIRKDHPYEAYSEVDFELITETAGDSWARTMVRLREIVESIKIIKQLIKNMPEEPVPKFTKAGPLFMANVPEPKKTLTYGQVEAPRGEDFHFYKIEKGIVKKARIRTPTFQNIQVIETLLKGVEIGDIPVIISSFDPCFSCMERMIVVKDGKKEVLKEDEFRSKYC